LSSVLSRSPGHGGRTILAFAARGEPDGDPAIDIRSER
jgi:hypothetical protein